MSNNELYCPKCCGSNLTYMDEKKVIDDFGEPVINVYYQCADCYHEWIEIVEVKK